MVSVLVSMLTLNELNYLVPVSWLPAMSTFSITLWFRLAEQCRISELKLRAGEKQVRSLLRALNRVYPLKFFYRFSKDIQQTP